MSGLHEPSASLLPGALQEPQNDKGGSAYQPGTRPGLRLGIRQAFGNPVGMGAENQAGTGESGRDWGIRQG